MTRMRIAVAAPTAASLLALIATPALAKPPANNALRNATVAGSLPFTATQDPRGSTVGGELQPTCADVSGTVWYAFTPTSTGTLNANTVGSNYDTVLAVYRLTGGSRDNKPVELLCDDDSGGSLTSALSFFADAGATYYFQIGKYGFRSKYTAAENSLTFNLS